MVVRTPHVTRVRGLRVGWVEMVADPPAGRAETIARPPVILIHGLGTSGAWWARTVPALVPDRRVLLVDLPGFGTSRRQPSRLDIAADVVADWMAEIGLDRADLVGHSMGGLVAADLAARHPERVDRLVLVDSAGLAIHHRVTQHLANVVRSGVRAPLGMYPVALRCVLDCGPVTIARAAHQILATDISDRLATISAPTLVLWGARDALLPPAYGRRLAAAIPTARFEAIEGAGHSPMWEQPAEFAATLVRFLAEPRGHASVARQQAASGPPQVEDDAPGAPTAATSHAVLAPTGGRIAGRYLAVGEWLVHVRVGRPVGVVETAPIVFVHGYVISSRYHLPTMRRLAHRHLVLAPDLPGFGWSSKPDRALDVPGLATALVAALDAAGIGRAILVGNSLGSQVAAQVAADHPDRVLATVLTGPTFDPAEPSLARHVLRLIAVIPYEPPSLLFEHVPDWIQAGLPRAIATLRHAWSHRIEAVLPHLRSPTVVVRGEHDAVVPRRWAVEAARLAPNGRALEIGGAAHALTYDAPTSLARIIEDVVASVESAARPNGDGLLPIRIVTATHRRRSNARPHRTRAGPPHA